MLIDLQSRLQALVQAEPLLAGRTVLIEDKESVAAMVEAALAEQTLCVVVAPSSGDAHASQGPKQAYLVEDFEVVIHRGLVPDQTGLTTVAVLQALIVRIHGAALAAAGIGKAPIRWRVKRHEIREALDGSFSRVLFVAAENVYPARTD